MRRLLHAVVLLAATPGALAGALASPARAASAARAADELQLSRDDLGLRLRRPDASWVVHVEESEPEDDTLATLSIYQPSTDGIPSVTIYVAEHDGSATAEQVRDVGVRSLEAQAGVVLERNEATLGGHPAARLHGRMNGTSGKLYEVELLYAVVPPLVYAVQSGWPAGEDFPASLRTLVDSVSLVPPVAKPPPDPALVKLEALADRCGSALPWEPSWDAAVARARAEDKLVLVVFEHFPGLDAAHTRSSGALMDGDVEALVQERCVMLRLEGDDPAPFRDAAVWGMGENSWGGVLLVVSPEGRVLEQTAHDSGFFVDELLRRALAQYDGERRAGKASTSPSTSGSDASDASEPPAASSAAPRDRDERLDLVARCLRRGELQRAGELLGSLDTPRAHILRAALHRRERRGEEALAELAAARRALGDAGETSGASGANGASDAEASDATRALLADLAVEEAVVDMRLARWEEAERALRSVLERDPAGPRATEAEFWLGAVEMLLQGFPKGRERWRALADAHPDDRWAWKAAANVLDGGAFVNGTERPHWPDATVFAAIAEPPAEALKLGQAAQAARDALAFLVAGQQPDGSWVAPMDAFGVTPSGYTFATTALCGSSLLPHRSQSDEIELALRRAVAYLLAVRKEGGLDGGTDLTGVYSIWSRAFALRFLAQAQGAGLGGDDEAALRDALDGLLDSIIASQQPSGGWPYVLITGTSAEQGFDGSASFLTAGVLIALLDARAAGLAVPQAPLGRGLKFLESMRQEDGSYRYFAGVPEMPGDAESAGRGPVCELALLRGGVGGLSGVRRALSVFRDRRESFRSEWGKDLCHTGAQGQGAHYLLYDWSFASAAAAQLPRSERTRWRQLLLTDLLAVRDAEGAYADMPSLGRAYGTAMALAALDALAK